MARRIRSQKHYPPFPLYNKYTRITALAQPPQSLRLKRSFRGRFRHRCEGILVYSEEIAKSVHWKSDRNVTHWIEPVNIGADFFHQKGVVAPGVVPQKGEECKEEDWVAQVYCGKTNLPRHTLGLNVIEYFSSHCQCHRTFCKNFL